MVYSIIISLSNQISWRSVCLMELKKGGVFTPAKTFKEVETK